MNNIEYEKKLIDLLGLTLVETEDPNKWIILDNNKQVGIVKKKKFKAKKQKNNTSDTFGYSMKIKLPTLHYNDSRKETENKNSYKFNVRDADRKTTHVKLSLGKNPSIATYDRDGQFMVFNINDERLYLNYNSKTEKLNIEETVIVWTSSNEEDQIHKGRNYFYKLDCRNINSKKRTSHQLHIRQIDENYPEKINVTATIWKNEKITHHHNIETTGIISQAIKQHEHGIKAFNHFRYLINQTIPMRGDIILKLLQQRGIKEYPFSLFIKEYNFDTDLSIYNYIEDITEEVKLGITEPIEILGNTYVHGDIIYKNGEVHNFDHILTNYIYNINQTEFYCWDKEHVFICSNPNNPIVQKAFDLKNKRIIKNYEDTTKIYSSYQKTKTHI